MNSDLILLAFKSIQFRNILEFLLLSLTQLLSHHQLGFFQTFIGICSLLFLWVIFQFSILANAKIVSQLKVGALQRLLCLEIFPMNVYWRLTQWIGLRTLIICFAKLSNLDFAGTLIITLYVSCLLIILIIVTDYLLQNFLWNRYIVPILLCSIGYHLSSFNWM